MCVRALAKRGRAGGDEDRGKGGLIRRENGQRRERKRTTTWFHPLLSHSWQRHALVTDRQITLLWLIKPGYRWREGRREGAVKKEGEQRGNEEGREGDREGKGETRGGDEEGRREGREIVGVWRAGSERWGERKEGENDGSVHRQSYTETSVIQRDDYWQKKNSSVHEELFALMRTRSVNVTDKHLTGNVWKHDHMDLQWDNIMNLSTWSKVLGQRYTAENKLVLKLCVQQSVMFGCPQSLVLSRVAYTLVSCTSMYNFRRTTFSHIYCPKPCFYHRESPQGPESTAGIRVQIKAPGALI